MSLIILVNLLDLGTFSIINDYSNKQVQIVQLLRLKITSGGGSKIGSLRVIKIVEPLHILPTAISPQLLQAVVIRMSDLDSK